MLITLKDKSDIDVLECIIQTEFNDTRFVLGTKKISNGRLKIEKIRLKESKPYCGNHPGSCAVNGDGAGKRLPYLEGLDWVEFNDRLNDILDDHNVEAFVRSSVCVIREGKFRRVEYGYHGSGNFAQWNLHGEVENHIGGMCMMSEFPMGTPGIYNYKGFVINND